MSTVEVIASGVTAFAASPATYRFVITRNAAGKMNILLEDRASRKQWCTGYLAEDEYVTTRNSIQNARLEDYIKVFKKIFRSSMEQHSDSDTSNGNSWSSSAESDAGSSSSDELSSSEAEGKPEHKLIPLKYDAFQLKLSVNFTLLESTWTVNYVFQLEPISLERIRALETKLRDLEEEQAERKRPQQGSNYQMVHLDATSFNNVGVNCTGLIRWSALETNGFELLPNKAEIRCLQAGWYMLSLAVFLTPSTANDYVELQLNGKSIRRGRVSRINEPCSVSCVRSSYLKVNDVLQVVVPSSQDVAAALTAAKLGG
ncbi:hypothetical protein PHYPSEUDO_015418 [Phytophthora pseudosyringae]|uniref:Uncharacterized protein n=1 Tax=Phytophthora pseudosyringae TaxID=221518 RepID=A0A8T1W3M2_9STRA|nr:hypothetical protein PHYPSEUDO_015418 [Phytophthora pseudosyringae]